jgi:uncharacterized membrane protein YccC
MKLEPKYKLSVLEYPFNKGLLCGMLIGSGWVLFILGSFDGLIMFQIGLFILIHMVSKQYSRG